MAISQKPSKTEVILFSEQERQKVLLTSELLRKSKWKEYLSLRDDSQEYLNQIDTLQDFICNIKIRSHLRFFFSPAFSDNYFEKGEKMETLIETSFLKISFDGYKKLYYIWLYNFYSDKF